MRPLQLWPPTTRFPVVFLIVLFPLLVFRPLTPSLSAASQNYQSDRLSHTAVGSKYHKRCASPRTTKLRFPSRSDCRGAVSEVKPRWKGPATAHILHTDTSGIHPTWEYFSKQITPNVKKPPLASQMSNYVQMWWVYFVLLWCKTKDSTTAQRPIY